MKIGNKLKELRVANGYTQEELATILSVSRSTISSWEINRTYPDLSMLVSLSKLYSITVDQLINEDEQLIDVLSNESKKNHKFKKIIYVLSGLVFVLALIASFTLLYTNNTTKNSIQQYEWADYADYIETINDSYFYKKAFISEIIDTLPNGAETKLVQSPIKNTDYITQTTLKIMRNEKNTIDSITILDKKTSEQQLQEKFGGNIQIEQYKTLQKFNDVLEDTSSEVKYKKKTGEQLVFLRYEDESITAFFRTD
jgi:transcriptional regulator with XRE-family HTH domain